MSDESQIVNSTPTYLSPEGSWVQQLEMEAGPQIVGHFDGFDHDWAICGWVQILSHADEVLTVEVFSIGALVATGFTVEFRPDVAEAGLASERCGFRLDIIDGLFDGKAHEFEVWVSGAQLPARPFGRVSGILPDRGGAATSRQLQDHSAFTDERKDEIQQIHTEYLEDILAIAHIRVDELEHSERALLAELDILRRQVDALQQQYSRQVEMFAASPHRISPGSFDGAATRMLSLTARRDAWLSECSVRGLEGAVYALDPHDGIPGPLAILAWGSGGIGDALYLTTVVRELNRVFQDCTIIVLHENKAAREVLTNNPYVSGVICLDGEELKSFVRLSHSTDVFDLIVEVKYAITYSAPPLSRVPYDFIRAASYRSAQWQPFVRYRWPHLNNLFAKEVVARGMSQLDLVGVTSMLPIDRSSIIDYFIDFSDHVVYTELSDRPFVSIHHGSDKRMASLTGQQTKNLPIATWNTLVAIMKDSGYLVIQLGESHEEPVIGVDHDYRGRTSLEQTAYLVKTASVHIDTEGGIVHVARAVNTPSVVAFGPTPVEFFGYPQNRNIPPRVCGDCWWTTAAWAARCPRGLWSPECMLSHSAEEMAEEALAAASASQRQFQITAIDVLPLTESTPVAEARVLDAIISRVARYDTEGAVVIGPERRFGLLGALSHPSGSTLFKVPADQLRSAQQALSKEISIGAYGLGNLSVPASSLDWAVAIGFSTTVHSTVSTLTDLANGLKPGGQLVFAVDVGSRERTAEDIIRTIIDTNRLRPGRRFSLQRGPEQGGSRVSQRDVGRAVLLAVKNVCAPTDGDNDDGEGLARRVQ